MMNIRPSDWFHGHSDGQITNLLTQRFNSLCQILITPQITNHFSPNLKSNQITILLKLEILQVPLDEETQQPDFARK